MKLTIQGFAAVAALAVAGLAGPASAHTATTTLRHDDHQRGQESRPGDRRDDERLVLRNTYGRSVIFRVLVEDERGDVRLRGRRGTLSNRLTTDSVRAGDRSVLELESVARGRRASTARIHVVVEDARRSGRRLDHFHRDVRVDDRDQDDHGHGQADNRGPGRSDDRDGRNDGRNDGGTGGRNDGRTGDGTGGWDRRGGR